MDPEKQENSNSVEKARVAEDDLDIKSDNFRDAATTNPDSHFDAHDLDQVQRRLNQRHIQMIAIAGTIGTGLFLGSGAALATAGPLGALMAYALVGTVAYSTLCSAGEMATWAPISGTFPHYAARWVDPAFGFALGWNYYYTIVIGIPSEITAATIVLSFWDTNTKHAAAYIAVICVGVCSINLLGVRYFGESEVVFSIIKLSLITGLILVGLVIDLGGGPNHERIGFQYWKDPGALNRAGLVKSLHTDRFLAILSVLVQAAFSFQGMETVVIAASETENPRRNIARGIKKVFYRIVIFYILGILVIGMLVAYDDEALLHRTGNAAQSPFVIAINRAGIKGLPHVINAAVFTSAFSATNSFLFCGSRILYGLALRGQAPRFLTYCTKSGLPLAAVLTSACFSLLAFMSINSGSETVFNWFVNIVTTAGFTSWCSVMVTYVFFHRGMKAQGFDLRKNVYSNRWQPYVAYWGIFWTLFFILVTGYAVFYDFTATGFLISYINIPIFAVLYFGFKIIRRTKIWRPLERDLTTGIPTIEETEALEVPPVTIPEKISAFFF